MYPALLASERFPVRLKSRRAGITPDELIGLCADFGVIAEVRIRTDRAEYPLRKANETIYPIGEFSTVLAGPDITALARHGDILSVGDCALYYLDRPFAGLMDALLSARRDAALSNDRAAERLAKLVANSLAGKLAQRAGKWVRYSDVDERGRWGESQEIIHRTGEVIRVRHVAGLAWKWDASAEHVGPHTAAFAYLTAYGRVMMANIRAHCPERSIVSQDTDGLWALNTAVDALRSVGLLADEGPGRLRIVRTARTGVWYGPRHYCVDGEWTLSGLHDAHVSSDGRQIRYSSRTPLFAARHLGAPDCVMVNYREATPPYDLHAGRVQEDGWILPPHILPGTRREER